MSLLIVTYFLNVVIVHGLSACLHLALVTAQGDNAFIACI